MAALAAGVAWAAGPPAWRWPFWNVGFARATAALAPGLLLAALALAYATRAPAAGRRVLTLLALASFTLQTGGWSAHGQGLTLAARRIESPLITSYFTDARAIDDVGHYLATFHRQPLHLHSATHPPGAILVFRALIAALGERYASLAGALLIALGTACGVFAVARLARFWGGDERAALLAGAFWALLPAAVLFGPELDQVYPLATVGLTLTAWRVGEGSRRAAVAFGALAALSLFFAYQFLTLGVWLLPLWAWQLARSPARRVALGRFAAALALAVAVLVGLVSALVVATGYRPFAAFARAVGEQRRIAAGWGRSWLDAVAWNLWDFALGAGVVVAVLAALAALRALGRTEGDARRTLLAAAALLAIDLTGLMRGETARVWLYLQPLAVAPAALEAARWRSGAQLACLAAQAAVTVAILARLAWLVG